MTQGHVLGLLNNKIINIIFRFPNLQPKDFEFDTKKYYCLKSDTKIDCDTKIAIFKDGILKELRKVLMDESNILKVGVENPYNVHYRGIRGSSDDKPPGILRCQLKAIPLKTLQRSDVGSHVLREFLPKRTLFENKNFNSCAIIASAGGLKNSKLGKFIGKFLLFTYYLTVIRSLNSFISIIHHVGTEV